jgi:hypothetical protein
VIVHFGKSSSYKHDAFLKRQFSSSKTELRELKLGFESS